MIRLLFALLIIAPLCLSAQENVPIKEKTFGVGIVPQYAITNGTRLDFDFKLPNKSQWLVVAPQFYMNTGTSNIWDYEEMVGAGIDLQHKLFFKNNMVPRGAYLAYGPVFQYFSVKDNGLSAYTFKENNVEYIGLNNDLLHTNIYKLGGNLLVGYQAIISDFVYLDFYMGTGIRLSFDDQTKGLHGYYNEWWGDLGYSGTLIVAGVRLGIVL